MPETWSVQMFHDGDCPLCAKEVSFMQRRDREGRIDFVDIAAPEFDAAEYGTTREDLMARIHGRLPDGTWIEGVEVFRQAYAALGFRKLVAITRWPVVRNLLGWSYTLFARNRLRLTGRCDNGACEIPSPDSSPS